MLSKGTKCSGVVEKAWEAEENSAPRKQIVAVWVEKALIGRNKEDVASTHTQTFSE